MILFDINSFPAGLDGPTWFDLYNKGIVIFDSHLNGLAPVNIDNASVALVDISNMSAEDTFNLGKAINDLNDKYNKEQEVANHIAFENNKKLITYLKKINDETI